MNDDQIIVNFLAGDRQAFHVLYNRHKKAIYGFCWRMLGDGELAKDGVQETFLRAFAKREQLREPRFFKTWLYSIAHRYCLSSKRHPLPRWEQLCHSHPEPASPDSELDVLGVDLLTAALQRLKADYREVVVLREYDGLTYQEMAQVTGTTISAVKSKLFKARRQLLAILRPQLQENVL
jgi:RNA polymerase sigma-70 factor (ECF subfamily)